MNIKDIAELAGVSHTTVSRVINNKQSVKDSTREKVIKVIQEQNFSPSVSAKALNSGKSYTIGLLVFYDYATFPLGFMPPILLGITNCLNQQGYSLQIFFDGISEKKTEGISNMQRFNNLDGVLVLSVSSDAKLAYQLAKIAVPFVVINQHIRGLEFNTVRADDEKGARQAVEHLITCGHKRIGMIGGNAEFGTSIDRKSGYIEAQRVANIYYDAHLYRAANFIKELAYTQTIALLQENPDVTAVFAANDMMALGVIRAAKDMGLRVPEDLSVVGFDDDEFSSAIDPPLTTVQKDRISMGFQAASVLLSEMQTGARNDGPTEIIVPTSLVIRSSTAKI